MKNIFNKAKYKTKKFIIKSKNECVFKKSKKSILKYKDAYYGKRCFIIGNGPSLTTVDLELIKNEIAFGSHGIYYIYDKTDWRPNFYCAQDFKLINERYSYIKEKCKDSVCIFGLVRDIDYPAFHSTLGIKLINENFDDMPKFSVDPDFGFYEGLTVTYFILQLAVYMGFKEIYLLGVDHFYSGDENDHFSPDDVCTNIPQTDKTTFSYMAAKKYADENGIKIYNATRGGHLEVFERVKLEEVKYED